MRILRKHIFESDVQDLLKTTKLRTFDIYSIYIQSIVMEPRCTGKTN